MNAPFEARRERLLSAMRQNDLDALFLTTAHRLGYAAGLFEDGHERLLLLALRANGDMRLICPALSENQARRVGLTEIDAWTDDDRPADAFARLANDWDLRTSVIAVEGPQRSDHLLMMQDRLPAALFRSGEPVLSSVMRKKDAAEIHALREAGRLVDEVWDDAHKSIRVGQTEREVQAELQRRILAKGGKLTFCILASGPASAEPHHLTDDRRLESGDVVIVDFGCELDHYQADITRTIGLGSVEEEAKEVYRIVYRAHHAAMAKAAPGATGTEVDAAARSVIAEAGYGQYFIHRTGHGIGLSGHEEPNMASTNHLPLEEGDAFSIEPGIYVPGRWGVRLENIVTCAKEGALSLNAPFPTEMILL